MSLEESADHAEKVDILRFTVGFVHQTQLDVALVAQEARLAKAGIAKRTVLAALLDAAHVPARWPGSILFGGPPAQNELAPLAAPRPCVSERPGARAGGTPCGSSVDSGHSRRLC